LKRRKVYHVAVVYLLVGWAVITGAQFLFEEALDLPEAAWQFVAGLIILGFPIALVLAWAYEVKPEEPRPAEPEDKEDVPPSIAVLPFVDMSPDQDQEYFCDGMAEELINALTKVKGLRVAARTSSFHFKGRSEDVREIGAQLAVRAVLEGSVRRAEERLRVTAQLVSVEDGYHLWSESYDRELKDVFAIQDWISRSIVEALRPTLLGEEEHTLVTPPTRSLEAYDHYLRGRYYWEGRYEKGLETALSHFEKAVEIDPEYALPHTGVADSYTVQGMYGYLRPETAGERARSAAERAVELDGGLSEAHASLGWWHLVSGWDWESSDAEFLKAIERNPDNANAHAWLGVQLGLQGRFEEALEEMATAERLDPLSNYIASLFALVHFFARDFDQVAERAARVLTRDPTYLVAVWLLSSVYSVMSRHDDAVRIGERAVALSNDASFFKGSLGWSYGRAGMRDRARAILGDLHARKDSRYISPLWLTWIHIGLGEKEHALDMLAQSIAEGDPYLVLIHQLALYDPLRSDPRFAELASQVGSGVVASSYDLAQEGARIK
jgi:serine/threonine-protein kinase